MQETQGNTTTHKKVAQVNTFSLATSPHVPFKYYFSFQTIKTEPINGIQEKFEQVHNIFLYIFRETHY